MSLRNKLDRLKPFLGKETTSQEKKAEEYQKDGNGQVILNNDWEKHHVKPYFFDGDFCFTREISYPLETKHGKYRFSQFIEAVEAWNHTSFSHPLSAKGYRAEQLFFFDTETTGLGGGAGNIIFLLGHASVQGDKIVVKQHLLPRPGCEVPLYQSFLENIDYTTLVTYNGKAFDWPQVKTRHTLIRDQVPKLPSFGHFDLFHAARRLWKHKLDHLNLTVVEKEILGIERRDDVPGFLAPMIYFDFVESQNPEGIVGILHHNERDILSLITLYTHLTYQLLGEDIHQTASETYEVGRWYSYIGETDAAATYFSKIANGNELESVQAKWALSLEWKKQQNYEKAKVLWEEIASSNKGQFSYEACIELAKFCEHKEKSAQKALYYAEKAESILNEFYPFMKGKDKKQQELINRLKRLREKLK